MLPKLPRAVLLSNVAPGTAASSSAGFYMQADATVSVSLTGADAALFSVTQVETEEVVSNPDGPHGSVMTLQPLLKVSGPGPIAASVGDALLVFVTFTAPADPDRNRFEAAAEVSGPGMPDAISIPLTAEVPMGSLSATVDAASFLPGQTRTLNFQVTSSIGHQISVVFAYDNALEPAFSAPSQPFTIAPGATIPVPASVTCLPGTPEGQYSLIFVMRAPDGSREYGSAQVSVTVTRTVRVFPSLPPSLVVQQGDAFRCELRVEISGSPADFSIATGPLPAGLSITPVQQNFRVDRAVFLGFDFEIAQNAPLGPMPPVSLFWTVREPEISDAVVFHIEVAEDVANFILPAPISHDSQENANPQPLVCDQAMLTCRPDGNWSFTAHLVNKEPQSDVSFLLEGKLDFVDGQGRQFGDTIDGALSASGSGAAAQTGLRILGYPPAGTFTRHGVFDAFAEPAFWQGVKASGIQWRMQPVWSEPMGGNIPDPPDLPDPPGPTWGSTGDP